MHTIRVLGTHFVHEVWAPSCTVNDRVNVHSRISLERDLQANQAVRGHPIPSSPAALVVQRLKPASSCDFDASDPSASQNTNPSVSEAPYSSHSLHCSLAALLVTRALWNRSCGAPISNMGTQHLPDPFLQFEATRHHFSKLDLCWRTR